jgi:hypothetical protein
VKIFLDALLSQCHAHSQTGADILLLPIQNKETNMNVIEVEVETETCVACGSVYESGHCSEYPMADGRLVPVCPNCDLELYPNGSNNQAFEDSLKPLAAGVSTKLEHGLLLTKFERDIERLGLRQEHVDFVKAHLWSL